MSKRILNKKGWRILFLICSLQIVLFYNIAAGQTISRLLKNGYLVLYNNQLGRPELVSWDLSSNDVIGHQRRNMKYFSTDKDLPKPRVKHSDFTNSRFQRGHMCPAADRKSTRKLLKETFLMANVAPQTDSLNVGAWLDSEVFSRHVARAHGLAHIWAGTIDLDTIYRYLPSGRVRVPSHFYKVLAVFQPDTMVWTWLFPNDSIYRRLAACNISPDSLERITHNLDIPTNLFSIKYNQNGITKRN